MRQARGKQKRAGAKRLLSLFLVAAMVVPCCEGGAAAAAVTEGERTTNLKSSRLEADRLPGSDCIYFGTASAEVQEQGQYAVRIYREGNLDKRASVEVHSVDMTALYGRDYEFDMEGVKVTEKDADKRMTILEKSMREARKSDSREEESESGRTVELTEMAREELQETAKQVLFPLEEQAAKKESDADATRESSGELAARKQEQTGTESRKLTGEELPNTSIMDALMEDTVGNAMESLEYSASCKVEFAPYESEKTVAFRVLEDDESEGNEGFSLILAEPNNAELYEVSTSAITILDDEEMVTSKVSFGKKEYRAEDGTVTVKLRRTGAEYSVCDVDVMTVEDTAKAGEDYEAVAQTVAFAPYQTEQEIKIAAYGAGSFDVKLTENAGCEKGKIARTAVRLGEKEKKTACGGSGDASGKKGGSGKKKLPNYLPGADNVKKKAEQNSFNIKISDRQYTVRYNEGDTTGKIMDEGYVPAVEAGIYYFPLPKDKKGIWDYNGAGKTYNWNNHYYDTDKEYGLLEWYSWWTGHKGYARMQTGNVIPGLYYQYYVPDWYSNNKGLGGNKSRFNAGTAGEDTKSGGFDRTQDMSGRYNSSDQKGSFVITAEDDQKNKTPKCYTYVYGVCAA